MTGVPPPAAEDVIDISPEQLLVAVSKVKAAMFHPEIAPSVAVVNAAAKTMLDVQQMLSKRGASVPQLRRFLGVPTPRKGSTNGTKKDGDDVPAPTETKPDEGESDESEPDNEANEEAAQDCPPPEVGAEVPQDDTKDGKPPDDSAGGAPPGSNNGAQDGKPPDNNANADEAQAPPGSNQNNNNDKGEGNDTKGSKNGENDEEKKGRDEHGRRGKADFPNALQRFFAHPDFDGPGCRCPDCLESRVFLMGAVGGGIRFTGQSNLYTTGLNYEIWRCGGCGSHFPAPLAPDIKNDGGTSRVGYSAAATIAVQKYLFGTPWARQERIGAMLDVEMPATTQCEQSFRVAKAALPVYERLFIEAALAYLFFTDDTGNKILGVKLEVKVRRTTGKSVVRTGIHTACVVAVLPDGREIVLYKTAIIHAGELLDEVLVHRKKGLPPPFHMSDGHVANPPTECRVISGECNSHARQKIKEKQTSWQMVWKYVKSVYEHVYGIEDKAKEQKLNPQDRMMLHRRESLPKMREMFTWMQKLLNDQVVDPNSELGKTFEYFLIREKGLTAFCFYPGFPIDNNRCESAQKLVALHRKNAEYFRSLRGACAGDVIMSLGATMQRCGGNIHEYLVVLQRYEEEVAKRPEDFLPWNYRETVKKLEAAAPPQRWREVSEAEFLDRQVRLRSKRAWGKAKKPKPTAPPPDVATTNAPVPEPPPNAAEGP